MLKQKQRTTPRAPKRGRVAKKGNSSDRVRILVGAIGSGRGFAKKCGVDSGLVSQWLAGRVTPSGSNLKRIAEATGVSIDWLLGFDVPQYRGQSRGDADLESDVAIRLIRMVEDRVRGEHPGFRLRAVNSVKAMELAADAIAEEQHRLIRELATYGQANRIASKFRGVLETVMTRGWGDEALGSLKTLTVLAQRQKDAVFKNLSKGTNLAVPTLETLERLSTGCTTDGLLWVAERSKKHSTNVKKLKRGKSTMELRG